MSWWLSLFRSPEGRIVTVYFSTRSEHQLLAHQGLFVSLFNLGHDVYNPVLEAVISRRYKGKLKKYSSDQDDTSSEVLLIFHKTSVKQVFLLNKYANIGTFGNKFTWKYYCYCFNRIGGHVGQDVNLTWSGQGGCLPFSNIKEMKKYYQKKRTRKEPINRGVFMRRMEEMVVSIESKARQLLYLFQVAIP
uniref:Uncharacterized protein n=1 Tax=Timema bartmani TaxID=61472 RepID=A0A7R9F9V1_9NEOP|nr:unnamed protein product [Timema bartmani]